MSNYWQLKYYQDEQLQEALNHPMYKSHKIGDKYRMDGKGEWEIWYYPIFADGKTQEPYGEPRALVKSEKNYNGKMGMDLREVPLRYIERIVK